MTDAATLQPAADEATLSARDRNFLIFYSRQDRGSITVELGIKDADIDAHYEALRERLAASASDPEQWPHTEHVVRRQVVDADEDQAGAVKRQRIGDQAHGPILQPVPDPDDFEDQPRVPDADLALEAELAGEPEVSRDPRRSPILDALGAGPSTASRIAGQLGRATGNVATRLRQLERGGFVRRTGRALPGGRGGPQIEWELADEAKTPTSVDDELDTPLSPPTLDEEARAMRRAYFDRLLALVAVDAPDHLFERIERVIGIGGAS